jgi:Uma2 family endonuclease
MAGSDGSDAKRDRRKPGRRATYDDLVAVPGFLVAEILGGELVTSPRPRPRHAKAESTIARALGTPFEDGIGGPGGWWILVEPELHLPDGDVLVPDVAGWRVERMPAIPEDAAVELAPDWVCEVLSPTTAARDRADKLPTYAAAGVAHASLVDPDARTLEVFRLTQGAWLLVAVHHGDVVVRAEPFEAVAIDLSRVWRTRAETAPAP